MKKFKNIALIAIIAVGVAIPVAANNTVEKKGFSLCNVFPGLCVTTRGAGGSGHGGPGK